MGGRDRILAAADKMFGHSPYSEVSIAPLLAEAGVQPPTLYHHFGDKEGLFVEWAGQRFAAIRGKLDRRNTPSLIDGLTAFSTLYFIEVAFDVDQICRDIPRLARQESQEKVYGEYFQSVFEPICAVLQEGIERGELPPEPVGPIGDLFLAGLYLLKRKMTPGNEINTARWYAQRFVGGFGRR